MREFDGDDRLPVIRRTARATLADAGVAREQLLAACAGCTGPMDPRTGHVLFSSIFEDDYDLAGALAATFGRRPVVENDCNLARDRRALAHRARRHRRVSWPASGSAPGSWSAARSCAATPVPPASSRSSAPIEPEHGAFGIAQLVRELSGEAPEAVFAAAGAGDENALAIVAARRALGGHAGS